MTSILTSIKKLLGIDESYTSFDPDVIIYINSAFSVLRQLGVGPTAGFSITGIAETWTDYLGASGLVGDVQTFIYLKVRLVFDPPQSNPTIEAIERQIKELEWRLQVEYDPQ